MLRLLAVLPFFAALALGGCTRPCMAIQEMLCSCEGQTQFEQDACLTAADNQRDLDPPTDEEEEACEALLPRCAAQVELGCETLETTEGRRACGIAAD